MSQDFQLLLSFFSFSSFSSLSLLLSCSSVYFLFAVSAACRGVLVHDRTDAVNICVDANYVHRFTTCCSLKLNGTVRRYLFTLLFNRCIHFLTFCCLRVCVRGEKFVCAVESIGRECIGEIRTLITTITYRPLESIAISTTNCRQNWTNMATACLNGTPSWYPYT